MLGEPWCFFGGEIEPGENPEQTLKRELKEEIGYGVTDFKLFKIKNYKVNGFFGKLHIYLIEFRGDISDICLSEGKGFAFFGKPELNSLYRVSINLETTHKYSL